MVSSYFCTLNNLQILALQFSIRCSLRPLRISVGKWNLFMTLMSTNFLLDILHRFRPAYKAFRNDSSFNFMVFFFVYFFQTILSVFQAIGFPGTGYCGFIVAIYQFDSSASSIIVGLLLLCIAFCFAATAAANILMITKVREKENYWFYMSLDILFSDSFNISQYWRQHGQSSGWIYHWIYAQPTRSAGCFICCQYRR